MQMLAVGDIASLAEGREIIRRSFKTETYQPVDTEAWKKAYARYTGTE
jgi:rhamnulokinase